MDNIVTGESQAFNSRMDPFPYIHEHRIPSVETPIDVRCPLPKKISPLYNILTPFTVGGWCTIIGTILAACLGFLAVNAIYGKLLRREPTLNWSVIAFSSDILNLKFNSIQLYLITKPFNTQTSHQNKQCTIKVFI